MGLNHVVYCYSIFGMEGSKDQTVVYSDLNLTLAIYILMWDSLTFKLYVLLIILNILLKSY